MNADIAIDEKSIPEDRRTSEFYDPNFLKFTDEEINALKELGFRNFTTVYTKETLREAIKTVNIPGILLGISARYIFNEPSDGIVSQQSAKEIERYCGVTGIEIPDGHHDICGDPRTIGILLDYWLFRAREQGR